MYIFSMPLGIPFLLFLLFAAIIPSNASTRFEQIARQANAARKAEKLNDAIRLYREGLRLSPTWADGWWALGSLLYDQDRFPEAEDAFRHLIVLTPKRGPADAFLGLCEYETREYDRALIHFRAWATAGWSGSPQLVDVAVFHFALLLTREGQFVRALYLLAPEAAKTGENPALSEAMGLASLRMRNLPEDYPPDRREMVWFAGESALFAAQSPHDYRRADEYAQRLIAGYDRQPGVHYFRATLFMFEQKEEEAGREFRAELKISPKDVPTLVGLAGVDLDSNQLDEATALAQRAVQIQPDDGEAHHVLGRALMLAGDLESSARELETAKRLSPDNAVVRSHLAIVYGRLGRLHESKAEAAAFLSLKEKEGVLAPSQDKTNLEPNSRHIR